MSDTSRCPLLITWQIVLSLKSGGAGNVLAGRVWLGLSVPKRWPRHRDQRRAVRAWPGDALADGICAESPERERERAEG